MDVKSTLSNFLIFAVGAAIGSAVSWKYLKTKYEIMAQEEIEEVRAVYAKRMKPENQTETDKSHKIANEAYKQAVRQYNTTSEREEEDKPMIKPHVIPPDDFGDQDDYEVFSWTYYKDGTVTDENDEVVEDVVGTLGCDPEPHFGEYEDDSVFIRDDKSKIDYEILRDNRNYADIMGG